MTVSIRNVHQVLCGRQRYALLNADCLEVLPKLSDQSIDMVLSDLPYGMTKHAWDKVLPLPLLWWHYKRILKETGAVVLTASQPFATDLASACREWFRYEWVWDKVNRITGHRNASHRPMKAHENILVFAPRKPPYRPQRMPQQQAGLRRRTPSSVLRIKAAAGPMSDRFLHPSQKPVELMEYLIRTYTSRDQVVLDNCMGSGTTGVACVNTGRRFIGIELDPDYFRAASARVRSASRKAARSRRVDRGRRDRWQAASPSGSRGSSGRHS